MGPPGGPKKAWSIYNGTLYLNYIPTIRAVFLKNADKFIASGNQRWNGWWGKLATGPVNTDCLADTWAQHNCEKTPQIIPPVSKD